MKINTAKRIFKEKAQKLAIQEMHNDSIDDFLIKKSRKDLYAKMVLNFDKKIKIYGTIKNYKMIRESEKLQKTITNISRIKVNWQKYNEVKKKHNDISQKEIKTMKELFEYASTRYLYNDKEKKNKESLEEIKQKIFSYTKL